MASPCLQYVTDRRPRLRWNLERRKRRENHSKRGKAWCMHCNPNKKVGNQKRCNTKLAVEPMIVAPT
ncbi:unnamed protein product [Penicillium camemberti]|uniref:Str. FM013 n=1 Tax=Penicillium camemberti (strain FM 013) TaxID=1429867 RepID=A0A0G4NWK7_PENC3|nr:unnamed protein product [Penicillium camemberti]